MTSASATPPEPSLIFKPSIVERLEPGKLFATARELEVELGSGDGSFVVKYALATPERNIIAVERLLGRLRKIDRKGRRAKLDNLRGTRIEAAYFLEFLLPAEMVTALHVYFPDPWPKRKHRKNRLINDRFTELAFGVLKARGHVFLRTDDLDYFTQMREVFGRNPKFTEVETPASLREIQTDFERTFNARGVSTNRAAYQKVTA
jgi:tRNA (guanine-N7-)-methyltransferase